MAVVGQPGPTRDTVRAVVVNALAPYGKIRMNATTELDLLVLDADLEHALESAQAFALVRTGTIVDASDILTAVTGGAGHGVTETVRHMLGANGVVFIGALQDLQRATR